MFDKYNIHTPKDLFDFFENNMNYGFTYRNKVYTDLEPDFQENMNKFYRIRLGENFIQNKLGVCWDFCELERRFFMSKNIDHECYFIESYISSEEGGPTHTFLIFTQNNKWFWFEYSWLYHKGIHEYNSKEEALKDIMEKFNEFFDGKLINISMYKTKKVTRRLDAFKFVEHCLGGEKVDTL